MLRLHRLIGALLFCTCVIACNSQRQVVPAGPPPPPPPLACGPLDTPCSCQAGAFASFDSELSCLNTGITPGELALVSLHGRTAAFGSLVATVEQDLLPLLQYLAALPPANKSKECQRFDARYLAVGAFGPRHIFRLALCEKMLNPSPVDASALERVATHFAKAEESLRVAQSEATNSHPCPLAATVWDSETWWQQRSPLMSGYSTCFQSRAPKLGVARCQHASARAERICGLAGQECQPGLLIPACQVTTAHCGAARQIAAACQG